MYEVASAGISSPRKLLTVVMFTRRLLIGSAMLLFAAALVAPVVSAMSLCAMPCCHHGAPGKVSFSGPPCPMKPCITKAVDEIAPAVAPSPVIVQTTAIVVDATPAPRIDRDVDEHRSAPHHRPLHLVHSVFLI